MSVVVQLETEAISTGREQMTQDDDALKSLSPLLNIMRLFGLYFTRKPRVSPINSNQLSGRGITRCPEWNASRIYATVMLLVVWLGTIRMYVVFDYMETVGADLFLKLASYSTGIFVAVGQTAYYAASHTGSLHRVFRQVDLSMLDFRLEHNRRMKLVTVLCLICMAANIVGYLVLVINGDKNNLNDVSLQVIFETYDLSNALKGILTAAFIIIQIHSVGALFLPLAMNVMVMMLLYDQFNNLNAEFSRCVGDGGEFSGNFEQFRRRHQAISRSVNEADRFLKISNVACFCFQMFSIILILYSVIFYRQETVSIGGETAMSYFALLLLGVTGLSLTAGLAAVVNHVVSKHLYCESRSAL